MISTPPMNQQSDEPIENSILTEEEEEEHGFHTGLF
jgi:hypothetical protein